MAGAAAFSRTVWIKPKSRGAIPICLALPSIITAKAKQNKTKQKKLHEMINTATQSNLAIHAFVVGQMLCIWSFMAYFKTITRDMIVRHVGSNRISDRWIKDI